MCNKGVLYACEKQEQYIPFLLKSAKIMQSKEEPTRNILSQQTQRTHLYLCRVTSVFFGWKS